MSVMRHSWLYFGSWEPDCGLDRRKAGLMLALVHICQDLEPVRRLLLENEPATRAISNIVFGRAGANATWVRVDDRAGPKVVLCRAGWLILFATSRVAARRLLDQIPAWWNMNFCATPSWVYDYVRRKRRVNWVTRCYMYALTHPAKLTVYRGHRVGSLVPEDSLLVARHWPYHDGKGDSTYIKGRIKVGPCCAIRRKGKPVAWALTHGDGSMGFLHVLEPYRGQGLARTIGTVLSQRLLKRGIKPFVHIEKKNRASIRLTKGMGFERIGAFDWFAAQPASPRASRT